MKYVCELCGTVYDEKIGDPRHGVPAGTAFKDLPAYYGCSVCGSEKEAFSQVVKNIASPVSKKENDTFWSNAKYSDGHHESNR